MLGSTYGHSLGRAKLALCSNTYPPPGATEPELDLHIHTLCRRILQAPMPSHLDLSWHAQVTQLVMSWGLFTPTRCLATGCTTLWLVNWEKQGADDSYSAHRCSVTPLEETPVAMDFLGAVFCVSKSTSAFILEIVAGLNREGGVCGHLL